MSIDLLSFENIKMVVTDLDDTLLRTDKTVSEYTYDVLRKCREKGVKVAYATGRGGSSENIVNADMFDCRILNNGAVIHTGDTTRQGKA